jgi:preprotein translocase subunit Sss1
MTAEEVLEVLGLMEGVTPEQFEEMLSLVRSLYSVVAGIVVIGVCGFITYLILKPILYFLY